MGSSGIVRRARRYGLGGVSLALALTGALPSHVLRRTIYRHVFGMRIDAGGTVYRGCEVRAPSGIHIGPNAVVGNGCLLDGREGLTIAANANLSSGVWIWTRQHDPQSTDFAQVGAPVAIQSRVWVGARATVLPGITLGEGCVVAAGSVVSRDVAAYHIVAGVPARPIGERSRELTYVLGSPVPFV
jgi:acetyltransferase-like isoleucine patch superfamily enzyme